MDSSLHFKLTRAIVAMFNNELNMGAQLIFATVYKGIHIKKQNNGLPTY